MVVDGQGHSAVFQKKINKTKSEQKFHVVSVPTAFSLLYFYIWIHKAYGVGG